MSISEGQIDRTQLAALARRHLKSLAALSAGAGLAVVLGAAAQLLLARSLGASSYGVIVTAKGAAADFCSRFFAPRFGVPEDPVTGSAHCQLTPYWARKLGKKELTAHQVSARGGELHCVDRGSRVEIRGRVAPYLDATITI